MSPDKAMIGYLQARIAELEAEVERLNKELAEAEELLHRTLNMGQDRFTSHRVLHTDTRVFLDRIRVNPVVV